MARNRIETERATLSGRLFGRKALTMPTGSPTSQEIRTESSAISALSGPRCRISSETLSSRKNDVPRLPVAMSRIQSPRSSMIRARSPGASFEKPSSPNMATSGSPGRILNTTKMIRDTPTRVETPNTARRSRYFLILGGGPRPPALEPRCSRPRRCPSARRRRCRRTWRGSGRERDYANRR